MSECYDRMGCPWFTHRIIPCSTQKSTSCRPIMTTELWTQIIGVYNLHGFPLKTSTQPSAHTHSQQHSPLYVSHPAVRRIKHLKPGYWLNCRLKLHVHAMSCTKFHKWGHRFLFFFNHFMSSVGSYFNNLGYVIGWLVGRLGWWGIWYVSWWVVRLAGFLVITFVNYVVFFGWLISWLVSRVGGWLAS